MTSDLTHISPLIFTSTDGLLGLNPPRSHLFMHNQVMTSDIMIDIIALKLRHNVSIQQSDTAHMSDMLQVTCDILINKIKSPIFQ